MLKYFIIWLFLIYTISVNAQLVSKKDFRLGNFSKSFLLNTEIENQSNHFALKTAEKNLTLAGFLSFIAPGAALGQFYKEEYVNGAIRVGISVLCAVWFLASPPSFHGESSSQYLIPLSIYGLNWIASIIDASSGKKSESKKPPRGFNKFRF